MSKKVNIYAVGAYWLLGVIWGSNFIYMKMASAFISPLQIVFFRVLFGFIPVCLYAWSRKLLHLQHLRHFFHFLIMSLLATSVYYFCFAKGTSLLFSGIAGALSGAIPLFAFILAVVFIPDEKASWLKIVGILVGFAGVALIVHPTGESLFASNLEGVLYMISGSLCLGASFIYARKFLAPLKIPVTALTTYQLGFALLLLSIFTDYQGIGQIWGNMQASLGLIIGLGLLGTGLAYIAYYYIVESMGAMAASSVTYIPPVIALLIGAFIVGEPLNIVDYIATGLIFIGVYLLKM